MNKYSQMGRTWLAALAAFSSLILAMPAGAAPSDVLGPGDSVRITVFQNPDLTTEARISAQGTIRMPLVGQVELSGLTQADAISRIAQRLKDNQILKEPEVTLTLLQVRSRQVSVLGQVARPGRYALDDTSSRLIDVLAQAGGITAVGDDTVTVITHRTGKTEKLGVNVSSMYRNADLGANLELESGDTVFVQRAPVFYISGAVRRAGAYRLEDNLNVIQALTLGGGITERGTERGMTVHRRNGDGKLTTVGVDLSDKLQADDVLFIKESFF